MKQPHCKRGVVRVMAETEERWAVGLHEYISSAQWTTVSAFVESNCVLFGSCDSDAQEHGEGEYALYVQFRSLVERALDTLLDSLGCKSTEDEERLAAWLREASRSEACGPREATRPRRESKSVVESFEYSRRT